MKIRYLIPAALLVAAACSSSDDAASSPPGGGTKAYDVAGIRIGMSLDEAKRVLAAKGFGAEPSYAVKGRSWPNAVATAIARAKGQPTPPFDDGGYSTINLTKGGAEVSMLDIRPAPAAGIVTFVSYSAPLSSPPFEKAKADAIAKYGKPSHVDSRGDLDWCSSENCRTETRPSLKLSQRAGSYDLNLEGTDADKAAADKVLADAVSARIGTSKPDF